MSAAAAERAASLGQRALAWTIDLLLLSPLLYPLAWPRVARALDATLDWLTQVQSWMVARMLDTDRMPSLGTLAQDLLADPVQGVAARAQVAQLSAAVLQACLWVAVVTAAYFVGFESSRWQATPGKRLLGLRVESASGARLGPGRASLRHGAGALSWLTLNLGHLLIGFRPDGRALHDLVADTRVRARGALPAWGRLALAVLVGFAVLAPLWFVLQAVGRLAGV